MNDKTQSLGGWIKPVVIAILSILFFLFGISILISSYLLNNPLEFIMTFFSSSLMILISGVGLCFSATRIYRKIFPAPEEFEHEV